MYLINKIKELAASIKLEILETRRHIHQNPELSFKEFETMKFVSDRLNSYQIEHSTGIAGTGIVGLIKGKNPDSKTIALRADMDALPIQEQNDCVYKSKNNGVMHACGHDVHTASLLGASKILQQLKDEFEGTIKLIFQPGEEKIPGGASLMIKEGVLENPKPTSIIGQHVMPYIPVGKVGFRSGAYMASADEIYMTIKGKGGHAALPENFVDPVTISAYIITSLQQVISRQASPKTATVLSFGKVIADGATNVIPTEVRFEGTFRAMDEKWRSHAHNSITNIATSIAESMGAACDIEIRKGYPSLSNEPILTERARTAAELYMGKENVVELDLWLAAEDFSFYAQEMPACFYRLGTGNESKGITSGVHTPTFDIDEDALETGAGLMAWLAVEQLI